MERRLIIKSIAAGALVPTVSAKPDESKPDESIDPEYIPNHFDSVEELKKKVKTDEWKDCKALKKRFLVARIPLISAGSSRERITCWLDDVPLKRVSRVWDVYLYEVGGVKIDYDEGKSMLSVTAAGTTALQGKVVASVILSALGS